MLEPEIASVTGLIDTYLRWANENGPPRGHEIYHPSAFGKCLRLMQYQRYEERGWVQGVKEDRQPNLLRTFGNGHAMHDRWRQYFENLGVLRGYWFCTNPLCGAMDNKGNLDPKVTIRDVFNDYDYWDKKRRVYGMEELQGVFRPEQCVCGWKKFFYDEIDVIVKELNFAGHCDMILDFSRFDPDKWQGVKQTYSVDELPKKPVVADMKTINHFGYGDVARGNPHSYYKVQLMIYANVLKCDYGLLIYENKNDMKVAAFRVEPSQDDLWLLIQEQARLMNEAADAVDEYGMPLMLLPPPRYESDSKDCKWCSFQTVCHQSDIWHDPEIHDKRRDFYGQLLEWDVEGEDLKNAIKYGKTGAGV